VPEILLRLVATLSVARSLLSCGVRLSVRLSVTLVSFVETDHQSFYSMLLRYNEDYVTQGRNFGARSGVY